MAVVKVPTWPDPYPFRNPASYVPNAASKATRLKPDRGWAPAWDEPNPRHFIMGFHFHDTRSACWDDMLRVWFVHGVTAEGEHRYARGGGDKGPLRDLDRHAAIKWLRRKGVRVVRVEVGEVPA